MCAAFETLTALKIAVRGRSATFARRQTVGIHRQTHRAARFPPFETGGEENLVQTFSFRLFLDQPGAGNDHGVDMAGDLAALRDFSGFAQILDTAIGAGADEDAVDLDVGRLFAALEP